MRTLFKILASIATLLAVGACSSVEQNMALRFRGDGTFKIVQFTDTHVTKDSASYRADSVIRDVLAAERPDLVVFTGDQIFGRPAATGLERQFSAVASFGIPFVYTFGNHDREQDMTGAELAAFAARFQGSVLPAPKDTLYGYTYGDIPILSSRNDSTAAVIYIFDSDDYPEKNNRGIEGYAWMPKGQIDFYSERSKAYTASNNSIPIPSVAFYHIPIPEYKEATILTGTFAENICAPEINSGLFAQMIERGDVFANFVGHDHNNNFVAMFKGMALCYGQFSGGNTVYNNIGSGARVIELREGSRNFRTWVRMLGGETKDSITVRTSSSK